MEKYWKVFQSVANYLKSDANVFWIALETIEKHWFLGTFDKKGRKRPKNKSVYIKPIEIYANKKILTNVYKYDIFGKHFKIIIKIFINSMKYN